MDYTKFLNKTEHVVLAYLGGRYAFGKDRRLTVDEPRPPIGFHRFEVKGKKARALEAVESPENELRDLPRVRGHHVAGWIAPGHASGVERVSLLPAEEPAPFAIIRTRRWHSGDLVFESFDFDGEVEEEARLRLERLEPIVGLKGVAASLRTAYGIAFALAVARRADTPLSVREAACFAASIADGGERVARDVLTTIAQRRAVEAERTRIRDAEVARREMASRIIRGQRVEATLDNASIRAEAALAGADARFLSSRSLGDGNLEVAFEFMGERFVSVVDAITLHVFDSGVCLAGADELVTLESLPGVIREAIETDLLVITRH
jgi:hypothetical protein